MEDRRGTAVVTGANRADGIGLALVRELLGRGFEHVVGTYRDPDRGAALLELASADARVRAAALDVASDASAAGFARWCEDELGRVDLLVNNAGIGGTPGSVTTAPLAELERQVQVHAVGMLRVTRALLPLMQRGAVVANISSGLASIARMGSHYTFYGPAKALQNALTRQLAAALAGEGIIAFSVAPGWVVTSMGGDEAPLRPEQSASAVARLLLEAGPEHSGSFRRYDGEELPW